MNIDQLAVTLAMLRKSFEELKEADTLMRGVFGEVEKDNEVVGILLNHIALAKASLVDTKAMKELVDQRSGPLIDEFKQLIVERLEWDQSAVEYWEPLRDKLLQ